MGCKVSISQDVVANVVVQNEGVIEVECILDQRTCGRIVYNLRTCVESGVKRDRWLLLVLGRSVAKIISVQGCATVACP